MKNVGKLPLLLLHVTVFAVSSIGLGVRPVDASGVLTVLADRLLEEAEVPVPTAAKRRRTAAVLTIETEDDDLFAMPTFSFATSDGSDSAVYTKLRATRRSVVTPSGQEQQQVFWEGAIFKNNKNGFATLLRRDKGPIVATFTTSVAAYELDTIMVPATNNRNDGTTVQQQQVLTTTLWEHAIMGTAVEAPIKDETSLTFVRADGEPSGLAIAGSWDEDYGGPVTTSVGVAGTMIEASPSSQQGQRRTVRSSSREMQATAPVVDVLVLVTNRAMCRVANLASGCAYTDSNFNPIADKILLAEMQSNSAIQQVGVNVTFRFVRTIVLTTDFDANPDTEALDVLKDSVNVRTWMDEAGADLVTLLTGSIPIESTAGGTAYLNRPESVTSVDFLSSYILTHELGHNFGCYHDRLNSGFDHPYSHALQVPNEFRTVMAYPCSGSTCNVIPYYSASGYIYNNIPMGNATHDNARRIKEQAPVVAAWTATRPPTLAPAPAPVRAPVTAPVRAPVTAPVSAPAPVVVVVPTGPAAPQGPAVVVPTGPAAPQGPVVVVPTGPAAPQGPVVVVPTGPAAPQGPFVVPPSGPTGPKAPVVVAPTALVPQPRPVPRPTPRAPPVVVVDPSLFCATVSSLCPGSNLMKKRRFLFFRCAEACVDNLDARRFRFYGWRCGGC